jgi:hypothetical protein
MAKLGIYCVSSFQALIQRSKNPLSICHAKRSKTSHSHWAETIYSEQSQSALTHVVPSALRWRASQGDN